MSTSQVPSTMEFNKYDVVECLDDSRDDWTIQVRAQSIWKGITKKTGEFRGYNIVFFDDSVRYVDLFLFNILICLISRCHTYVSHFTCRAVGYMLSYLPKLHQNLRIYFKKARYTT